MNVLQMIHYPDLAGPKQQSTGDGWDIATAEDTVVPWLWFVALLHLTSIITAIEVVIIPGKTENSHSCRLKKKTLL